MLQNSIPTDTGYCIGVNAVGFANSNSITSHFLYGFLDGRKINNTHKEDILGRSNDQNRFGFETSMDFYVSKRGYRLFNQYHNSALFFRTADRQILNIDFSKELISLALYGNKQYKGNSIDLGHLDLNFYRFQQFQVGWFSSHKRHSFGFGLSYLNGERLLSFNSSNLSLGTSELGDEVKIYAVLEAHQSDTANQKFLANNGNGASIDLFHQFDFNISLPKDTLTATLRTNVTDLGMIIWDNRTVNYDVDSSYNYLGTQIDDIFDLGDSILTYVTPDSIYDALTTRTSKGVQEVKLPVTFQTELEVNYRKWTYGVGGVYKLFANYTPFGYLKARRELSETFIVGGNIGYGGYGTLSYGIETFINLAPIQIGIGSKHLEGMTFSNSSGGNQLFFSLKTTF